MSVDSIVRSSRTIALAAAAAALVVPTAAFAGNDKDKDKGAPAACEGKKFMPPGQEGRETLPPGIAKKQAKGGAPCDKPEKPEHGNNGNNGNHGNKGNDGKDGKDGQTVTVVVQQPAPAPAAPAAPVTTVAPSSTAKLPPCVKGKWFKVKLNRWGAVRRARVLLNGRPITVKISKKGRKAYAVVDLRHRKAGTYIVRQSIVTRSGKLRTGTHRYRLCG